MKLKNVTLYWHIYNFLQELNIMEIEKKDHEYYSSSNENVEYWNTSILYVNILKCILLYLVIIE